jgi:hypothetical protein
MPRCILAQWQLLTKLSLAVAAIIPKSGKIFWRLPQASLREPFRLSQPHAAPRIRADSSDDPIFN